ncbi:ABC transporter ATP-binding protein [Segeticoccus rhizosphaerae]|jgi:ATP-binding cassette subfamily B protein|uniref:ABC transporter ATP-binding protein n=1 Tax=Segeticoccus rhizosphaerae TaxID=1104777 RepID=UPI0010BFBC24|nr:ABC transporter ATP-binding protein [Ornithinicoccus soli]
MTDQHGQRPEEPPAPDTEPAQPGGPEGQAAVPPRLNKPQSRGPQFGSMGMPAEKSMNFGPSAKRLIRQLRPERARVIAVLVLAVVSVGLSVLGPKILGRATDVIFAGFIGSRIPQGITVDQAIAAARAQGESNFADMLASMRANSDVTLAPGLGIDFAALGRVLLLVVALYVGASLLMWIQGYLLNDAVQRTVMRLRRQVEEKVNTLPLGYFDNQPRGELLSRVTNDIDNIQQSLQQTMSQLLTSLLTVIGVLVMMFVVSPLLAIIALVMIPVSIIVTQQIAKRSQKLFVRQWTHTGELNGQIEEAFTGHELVKVFGRSKEVEASFAKKNEELFQASFGAQFVSGIIMPAMMFIGNLSYVIVAVVGGLRVASGSMSLGDVQAFIQYSRQFTQPLTQVASMANLLQSGVASAERVFDLLDAHEQVPERTGTSLPADRHGRVEFEHVSFRYQPDKPLIDDLSLVADPGHTVAIVGPTGAGKTTLVNLVMRFYELDSGRITLDGVDITDLTRHDLRGQIGMVLQDTWLFGGTIRDNIAYGNLEATEAQILEAAEATYVDRFVRTLPDGYDTVIDEEGSNVSAGEKQLLTIARAFLADPSLLILDEATSSVDTRTEVLVQRAMNALRTDRTSFVIAHRLSTIRDADLILVMESGQIVEQGSHEQLLEQRGAYYRLYSAQFSGAATDLDAESELELESVGAGVPGAGGTEQLAEPEVGPAGEG